MNKKNIVSSISRFFLFALMLCVTVAVAISADETYYKEKYDFFGSNGVITMSTTKNTASVINTTTITGETDILSIDKFNGDFYIGSSKGNVYKSSDGINFLNTANTGQKFVYDMVEHNGYLYIATGDNNRVCRTLDGSSWSCYDSRAVKNVYTLESNGSRIWEAGSDDSKIFYSDDGTNFIQCTDLPSNNQHINDLLVLDSGRLLVATGIGNIYYSENGCNGAWSSAINPPSASEIKTFSLDIDGSIHIGGVDTSGFGAVWMSEDDGATWTLQAHFSPNGGINVLVNTEDKYLIAGSELSGQLYESYDDGYNWRLISGVSENKIYDIFVDGSISYVSSGNAGVVYQLTPIPVIKNLALTTECGTIDDFDGDGDLDLIGFKNNESDASTLWSVYENLGTNNNPVFAIIYNFTDSIMGSPDNGGNCVASADIDGDGDLDFLTYSLRASDSTVLSEDTKTKTGNKGFFKNFGSNENIQLVLDDTLITPWFDLSVPFDGRFISCSEAGNCGLAGIDYNSNYLPEGFPTNAKLLSDACDACPSGYCDYNNNCYGSISYGGSSNKPYISFQFFDFDSDGDLDLWAGMNDGYGSWYENIGSSFTPRFVPHYGWNPFIYTSRDNYFWVDFDSDAVPDRIGGISGSANPASVSLMLEKGDYWINNDTRANVHNYSRDYSAPFTNDNNFEPVGYGYDVRVLWVGDYDGDFDADIITIEHIGGADKRLILYESQGVGYIQESMMQSSDTCSYPCLIDDNFDLYPDGTKIGDLPEWSCDDSVTVEDGVLTMRGNHSLTRCCIDLGNGLTSVGTVDFYINPMSECKFSSYNNGFNELSVLHEWDNNTGEFVYNYLGDLQGRSLLRDFQSGFWSHWLGVYDINYKKLDLTLGSENFNLDFYDGADTVNGVNKLCWNPESVNSICRIDDLLVYVGTDRSEDTTGELRVNDSYECYAGFCYRKDDVLYDSRPSAYTPQSSFIGGAFFDWNRCIAEGYAPNQLCILRLMWKDGSNTLKNWFIQNIVPIFILILLITVLAITVLHSRRRY